jgi:O-antigen ligase
MSDAHPPARTASTRIHQVHRALTLTGRLSIFGLLLTPLIFNPWAYLYGDAFFPPKWAWIGSMSALGAAAVLTRSLIGAPLRFMFDPAWTAALVFFLLHPLSLLWADSPSLGVERSLQIGAATLALAVGIQVVRTRRVLLTMAWIAVAVAVVTALWTLQQDFAAAFWPARAGVVPNLPDWRGYLAAGLGNTNHIGDLLALAILIALVLFAEARRRHALIAAAASLVILAAGLTVCWSVGSNLGLFAGAAMLLLLLGIRRTTGFFRRRRRWVVLAALWAAMLAFFLSNHPLNPHAPGIWNQAFGSDRWQEGGSTRLVIWAGGLEIVRLHPLLGVGAGNFTYAYPEMRSVLLEDRPDLQVYEGHWTNAAHNELLQVWSELGILGLVALLALVAMAFHSLLHDLIRASRREFMMRTTLAAALAAFCVHAMMNFTLVHPTGVATFYSLLLAIVAERGARPKYAAMPPLLLDRGWLRLHVEWKDMKRYTGVGISFRPPRPAIFGIAVAFWLLAFGASALLLRPVLAESRYGLASVHRSRGNPALEERHILRALALNPWATGCRSRYVEFLLEQNRPAEALQQLDLVRRRLNSRELWEREARALHALGRSAEAEAAYAEYLRRLPRPHGDG